MGKFSKGTPAILPVCNSVVTINSTGWNIKKMCVLYTQCNCVFCMILSMNIHYIPWYLYIMDKHAVLCTVQNEVYIQFKQTNQPKAQLLADDGHSNSKLPSHYLRNFTTTYLASSLSLQEGRAGIA